MPTKPIARDIAEATIAAVHAALEAGHVPAGQQPTRGERGAMASAAIALSISPTSMTGRLDAIRRAHPDLSVDWSRYRPKEEEAGEVVSEVARSKTAASPIEKVREKLKRGDADMATLRTITGFGDNAIRGMLEDLKSEGFNVHQFGDRWSIEKTPPLPGGASAAKANTSIPTLVSGEDNTFLVGVSGDQHLCSQYERLDVLNDLYDRFERAEVQAVYNTGNWIDGEARFNKHELHTHGMQAQCKYLAEAFPRRNGIETFAVAGDDHEGWYGQREGVDIGQFAENIMRAEGRHDWHHLGFMEAYVKLINANTGKSSILSVTHPGGGSAYALSYSIQKIIEALDGGEKPAVGFYGHYHKLWAGNIRNVWCLQSGCTQDQTAFMRKKKLEAHVGGAIVRMEQDPETGAIIGFEPNMIRYFNRGYYTGRWGYAGSPTLPERSP